MRVAARVAMFVSDSKPSWSPVRALRLVLLLGLLLGWDHFSDAHKVAKGNHAQDDAAVEAAAAPPVIHKPAENDQIIDNTVTVSWTAAAGTGFVDVHICRDKVLDPSACVRVRSAMKAQKFGESGNSFTLHIGGETRGGKKKSWQMPQEPCKLGLN